MCHIQINVLFFYRNIFVIFQNYEECYYSIVEIFNSVTTKQLAIN